MSVEERRRTCGRLLRLKTQDARLLYHRTLRMFGLSSAGCVDPNTTIIPAHRKVFVEQDVQLEGVEDVVPRF